MKDYAANMAKELSDLLGFLERFPHPKADEISDHISAAEMALREYLVLAPAPPKRAKRAKRTPAQMPLWVFNWKGGGYNQVYAETRIGAIRKVFAEFGRPSGLQIDLNTLRALHTVEEQAAYYRSIRID